MRLKREYICNRFWRELMNKLWHDPDCRSTHGIMSAALIADHMELAESYTKSLLDSCVHYGITERQGGGYVV